MKRILLLLSIAVTGIATATNPEVARYTYDSAGNRVSREIIIGVAGDEPQDIAASLIDVVASRAVRIYPNPTNGKLTISIDDYEEPDQASFIIYDLSGVIVYDSKVTGQASSVDISDCQSGIYILTIMINGNQSSWRIIKK